MRKVSVQSHLNIPSILKKQHKIFAESLVRKLKAAGLFVNYLLAVSSLEDKGINLQSDNDINNAEKGVKIWEGHSY